MGGVGGGEALRGLDIRQLHLGWGYLKQGLFLRGLFALWILQSRVKKREKLLYKGTQ